MLVALVPYSALALHHVLPVQIEYVRLYQSKSSINIGCDPPGYPTTDYIQRNINKYMLPSKPDAFVCYPKKVRDTFEPMNPHRASKRPHTGPGHTSVLQAATTATSVPQGNQQFVLPFKCTQAQAPSSTPLPPRPCLLSPSQKPMDYTLLAILLPVLLVSLIGISVAGWYGIKWWQKRQQALEDEAAATAPRKHIQAMSIVPNSGPAAGDVAADKQSMMGTMRRGNAVVPMPGASKPVLPLVA